MIRIALCLDPSDLRSAGIVPKVLRGLDPTKARDARDRQMRQAKQDKILRELVSGSEIPSDGRYPGLDRTWNAPPEKLTGILISHEDLKKLAEKIVRGIFFIEDQKFIGSSHVVEFFPLTDESAKPVIDILEKVGSMFAREPGIAVWRATAQDDPLASLFCVEIWGQFKMYATVMPAESMKEPTNA